MPRNYGEPRLALDEIKRRIGESENLTALGACVFAGGFSFGMEEAGFDVVGHLELPDLDVGAGTASQRWPVAVAPLDDAYEHKNRHGNHTTWMNAVDELLEEELVPDVLHMNPPYSAFAQTGLQRGLSDPVMCYLEYCVHRLALRLKPKVFVWELVPGIWDREPQFINSMAAAAAEHGYRTYSFLTTAALHGGFQNRNRFHFIASKYALDFEGVYEREPADRKACRTLGDVLQIVDDAQAELGRLPNHEADYQSTGALDAILPFVPPGGYLGDVPDPVLYEHYRPNGQPWKGTGRPGATRVRGRMDRTCPVIIGGASIVHPEKDRWLTVRECAAAQGFPMDYEFPNGGNGYAEVGKGLCTHNAAFVGRVIWDALANKTDAEPNVVAELIDWRKRTSVPKMTPSIEERRAWFKEKHPDLPIEYAERKKSAKKGGKKRSRKQATCIAVPAYDGGEKSARVMRMLRLCGITAIVPPDNDPAGRVAAFQGSSLALLIAEDQAAAFQAFMDVGTALGASKPVLTMFPDGVPTPPGVTPIPDEADAAFVVKSIVERSGMNVADVVQAVINRLAGDAASLTTILNIALEMIPDDDYGEDEVSEEDLEDEDEENQDAYEVTDDED